MSDNIKIDTDKIVRRKIQVVGGNTITVSLPRSWADKHKLGKEDGEKDEIAIRYLPDGSLAISPANSENQHVERVRIHKYDELPSISKLKRILLADFMGGIDIIRVQLKEKLSTDVVFNIQNYVNQRLIGFDIIEIENGIDVVNMTQSPKLEVTRLLEMIRVQITRMMDQCYKWLRDDSIDIDKLYDDMKNLEVNLDRWSNQMMRTLQLCILDYWMAERVNLPMAEVIYWAIVTRAAENAAELVLAISHAGSTVNVDNLGTEIVDDLFNLGKTVTDLFSRAISSFNVNDFQEAHEILERIAELSATTQRKWPIETADLLGGNMTLVLRHFEKIGVYTRKIAEATIDCEAARIAYTSDL